MTTRWLNLYLRYSGYAFNLKQKIVGADNWLVAVPYAALLIVSELGFTIISLPVYILVPPNKIQEEGFIIPIKAKEKSHISTYAVRRKLTLATFFGAGGVFLLKVFFIGAVSFYLLGIQALLAATQNWDFSTASDYTYTAGKIAVTGGVAQLVDQGGGGNCSGTATTCSTFVSSPTCVAQAGCSWSTGGSGSTINPGFNSNSTGWTYASWAHDSQGANSGNYQSSGGIPGGYVDINLSVRKNKTEAGYWRQATTTSISSPDSATLKFDWKSITFGGTVTSYKLYAFIDTASTAPVSTSSAVWSSPEITATTAWASSTAIDVKSKLSTAGTYYVKFAAYAVRPNSGSNNLTYVSGFDNVSLTWSKAAACSGTATACNTYVASPACSAQGGCAWNNVAVYPTSSPTIYPNTSLTPEGVTSWNAFTETATKGTGEIYYQLSNNNGTTWKYWNNSAWVTSTLATHYNTASVVNNNIGSFGAASGQIKWKAFLVSNGSQQITLDNVAVGYIQNNPPSIQSLTASQSVTTGYVQANYSLVDAQSDPSSLVNYEYTTDNINWSTATAMPTDPAHSGVSGLTSSPAGTAHAFVWNALNDLGSIYSSTVYFRMRANDGIASGGFTTSTAITVDYVAPVVSNVTAVQAPGSSNINIGYDLFDNTTDNILVQLQVSADGGSTWTVPATSVSGDVGSTVASGNGKTIVWLAGTDYADQEKNNMMVRVRAKDKYQNQGGYAASASFALDNKAPAIAVPADLLAQPLAGATTALIGGSFTESNPDTNNFYVAINGNSYGSAEAGDTGTATPSDKSVPVGVILKGNDYISKVKIVHADTFGHSTDNENSSPQASYKYVKPYTPPAPTISNPGEASLDVTINKHNDEADGLEYAIFENTQSQYVQSDGSLGAGAHWQVAGTINVIGLSQPISQYIFQVKSRNTSDMSNAASSESNLGSGASSDYQSPQIVLNSMAQTIDGTKYVNINYTGSSYQNHANDLVAYEYSLNGTDWQPMTEKSGVGSNGITGLAFTSGGAALKFVWDVGTDLPNVEDTSVYVRLQSNDSITNSNLAVSGAFVVNTAGPVISNISASQTVGTEHVAITYDLADGAGANNTVELLISDDGGSTYSVLAPSVSGEVGAGVTAGLARSISWDVGADLPGQEKNTMRLKIRGTDSYGNQGEYLESIIFSIDTKAPAVSAVTAVQQSGSALVAVNYTLSDLSNSTVEFEVSSDSGVSWTVATSTYTGDVGAGLAAGARTFNWNVVVDFPDQESATMRVRVRAVDVFGHQGVFGESADFSINSKILSISNITATQNIGAKTASFHYDLNKTAAISLDISADSGATWTVATTTLTGHIGAGVTPGFHKSISWNPGIDFNNQELPNLRVRMSGVDSLGIRSAYYESADFSVDTAAPLGLSVLSKFASTVNSATMNWSSGLIDSHFNHYELWHGANRADVLSRNNTATKWSIINDASLGSIATISTVITGLNLISDYFVKIWAIDDYGNEVTVADLNVYLAPVSVYYPLEIQTSDGSGSTVPAIGNYSYLQDTSVQVAASASTSWLFDHWILDSLSGGNDNPVTVLMNATRTLQAVFVETTTTPIATPEPVITPSGGGSVIIISTPAQPVLTPLTSPTQNTGVLISGLAEAGAQIDLYDQGILVKRLNNPADVNGRFSQVFDLNLGDHVLTVKAVNSSGRSSVASEVVNLSIIPAVSESPIVLSPKNGDNLTNAEPVIIGVAAPLATIEIILDGQDTFTVTANADGAWQLQLPSSFALKNGAHTLAVRSIDNAGVKGPQTSLTVNKITAPIATAPITTVALPSQVLISETTGATELPGIPVPKVVMAGSSISASGDTLSFSGTSLPNSDVVVYIHSDQALVYRARTDTVGNWKVDHSQAVSELTPGEHTIYAVAVDTNAKIKSRPSAVSSFTVKRNFWVMIYDYLNWQTTTATLIVLLLAVFWLYRVRKTNNAKQTKKVKIV